MAGEKLLTVREVARRRRRSEETVRRWIWSGRLPARKLGNQWFVEEGEVARLGERQVSERGTEYEAASPARRSGTRRAKVVFPPPDYDVEEALRQAEDDFRFGQMLREKYGPTDVTELLRQVREEDDD
jgi:excisionase family DNA binding protein